MDKRKSITVNLKLTPDQNFILTQEQNRLSKQYGISITTNQIAIALIEQHGHKLKMMATENYNSVVWFYRSLSEKSLDE